MHHFKQVHFSDLSEFNLVDKILFALKFDRLILHLITFWTSFVDFLSMFIYKDDPRSDEY